MNRIYNTGLDEFYRFFMIAGFSHEHIFSDLKTTLATIKGKYANEQSALKSGFRSFARESKGCVNDSIKKYALVLEKDQSLTDDFKSTYIRWLYKSGFHTELLALNNSFDGIDYRLYAALVKYQKRNITTRALIKQLEACKAEQAVTEFPRTLFYTATTTNELEIALIRAYLKRLNFYRSVPTAWNFFRRNKKEVLKKILAVTLRKWSAG